MPLSSLMLGKAFLWGMAGAGVAGVVVSQTGLPAEAILPAGLIGGITAGAVGYGELKQRAAAAHKRIDDLTGPEGRFARVENWLLRIEGKVDDVGKDVSDIRVLVARLDPYDNQDRPEH